MTHIKHEILIMNTVLDSMNGTTEPIIGEGSVSARGRLMQRLGKISSPTSAQRVACHMYEEDNLLVLNNGVLELNLERARERVTHLLNVVVSEHPSVNKQRESPRDIVLYVMDRLTAMLAELTTATPYRPTLATS